MFWPVPRLAYLVNKVLKVLISERLGRTNDVVEVRVHELINNIHIV